MVLVLVISIVVKFVAETVVAIDTVVVVVVWFLDSSHCGDVDREVDVTFIKGLKSGSRNR